MPHVIIDYVALRPFWYQDVRTGERVDVKAGEMVDAEGLGPIAEKMCGYDLPSLARIVRVEDDVPSVSDLVAEEEDSDTPEGEFPKHLGGGWYELSNGENVKGRSKAESAEEALGGAE